MFLYIWLGVIIISFVIEAISMDLLAIWFTFGGLVAFISYFFSAPEWLQILLFLVVSLVLLLFTRPLAKKYFKTNVVKTNADRLIGKRAIVLESFGQEMRGSASIDGKVWTAITYENETFSPDEAVEVLAIEGVKLVVKKIKN